MEKECVFYKVVSKRKDNNDESYKITHKYSTDCEGISKVGRTEPVKKIKKFHKAMLEYLADGDINIIETKIKA